MSKKPRGDERRSSPRFPSELATACFPIVADLSDEPWPAQVRDISAGGVGLVLARRFEQGTVMTLELQNKNQDFTRTLLVRVVHVQAARDGKWSLGCAIAGHLDEEELQAVQAQRSQVDAHNDRAWVRYPAQIATICAPIVTEQVVEWPTQVLNICAGGIALLLHHAVDKGTLLRVHIPSSLQEQRMVLARVVHVTPQAEGKWIHGCVFVGNLTEDELTALLS